MSLWLLRPVADLPKDKSPWWPKYDCLHGCVVRAESELEARKLADSSGDNENERADSPWMNPNLSTCEPLSQAGEQGIILKDFLAG